MAGQQKEEVKTFNTSFLLSCLASIESILCTSVNFVCHIDLLMNFVLELLHWRMTQYDIQTLNDGKHPRLNPRHIYVGHY
jgi:hypothetical protein